MQDSTSAAKQKKWAEYAVREYVASLREEKKEYRALGSSFKDKRSGRRSCALMAIPA